MDKRIFIFMSGKGPVYSRILEGFYDHIATLPEQPVIHEFEGGEFYEQELTTMLSEVSVEDCELIITMGAGATRIAKDLFKSRKQPIPTVFCAVSEAMTNDILSQVNFMTGVGMKMPSNYLPLQMLLRICPDASSFLLPYRKKAKAGRMAYEVEQIKAYFTNRKVKVIDIPLGEDDNTRNLQTEVASVDAVIIPESGLTRHDIKHLEKICQQENTILFGDCQTATQSGGVFAFRDDLHFAGSKVAEFAYEISAHGKTPADLPPHIIESSRKLSVNPDAMAKAGVFLADDVLSSFEGALENHDIPTHTVSLNMHTETALFYSLATAFGHRVQKESSACYRFRRYVGWQGNTKFNEEQAQLIVERDYENHLFYDDRQAYETWQAAQKVGKNLGPMMVVSISDQMVDNGNWHKVARKKGQILSHLQIPAPDTLLPLHMLIGTKPSIKTISLIVKAKEGDFPDWLKARIDQTKKECKKRSITLNIFSGTSYLDARTAVHNALKETDAILYWPDSMCVHAASYLANSCYELNIPICAGGLLYGQVSPLCYGVDLLKAREELFKLMNSVIYKKNSLNYDEVILAPEDIYRFCINEKICKKMNLILPEMVRYLAQYGCVSTRQEYNMAACLNVLPRSELDTIRLEAARTSFSNNLKQILAREKRLTR